MSSKKIKGKSESSSYFQVLKIIFIIFSMLLIAYSVSDIQKAKHNIDLAYNFKGVSSYGFADIGIDYQTHSLDEYYIEGLNRIDKDIGILLLSALEFGVSIGLKDD